MKKILLLAGICLSLASMGQPVSKFITNEQAINSTCLLYSIKLNNSGSGTIFNIDNKRFFIVTASHVIDKIDYNSNIVVNAKGTVDIQFKDIIEESRFKWIKHPEADVAIMEISPSEKLPLDLLNKISLSKNIILTNPQDIPLSYNTTMIGYPHAAVFIQKIQTELSPIVIDTQTASKMTKFVSASNQISNFIFLSNPSIQGMSGGPVFISLQRAMTIGDASYLAGIIHGTNQDATGGKLAIITPSNYILEVLAAF